MVTVAVLNSHESHVFHIINSHGHNHDASSRAFHILESVLHMSLSDLYILLLLLLIIIIIAQSIVPITITTAIILSLSCCNAGATFARLRRRVFVAADYIYVYVYCYYILTLLCSLLVLSSSLSFLLFARGARARDC